MDKTARNLAGSGHGLPSVRRSLQDKAWLITAGVLFALAALLALGVDWVFRKESRRLEDQWVAECVRRVQAAHAAEIDALERSARDYAAWSDTYEFMVTAAAAYVENNLIASMFTNLQLEAFLLFDTEGRLHTGRFFREGEVTAEGGGELEEALAAHARRTSAGEGRTVKGAARVGEQVALFAARPILRDDDSGPPRGALVHVRLLDDARVRQLRQTLNLELELQRTSAPAEPPGAPGERPMAPFTQAPRGDREMAVEIPIVDANGSVVANWRLLLPREIYQQGVKARLIFYVVMCVLILAAAWVIGRLLRSMVIARLEAVHAVVRKVGDTSDLSPRVPVQGSDELTELAAGINRMFDALARSEAQRLAAEEEQERLNAQLQHAQKMEAIGTLTGGLAHDFNNLLTSIQGSAALIRLSGPSSLESERHLGRIEKAASQGASLVRQMMAFGRRTPAAFADVRLSAVVRDALQLLRASVPRGIEFDFANEAEGDVVHADPAQLQQVLINLGTNASHAMAGGSGKLTIRVSNARLPDLARPETAAVPPGEYLRLTVGDTGCGIASQDLNRIFEPFFTTKPVGCGTGLGLAVVHGIVAHHHGTIGVESREGAGTTFFIHLPKVRSPAAEPRPATAAGPAPARPSAGSRVLLVDDDQMVRETLTAGLKRLGYQVTPVAGGREALEILRAAREPIDLLITDQMMPGMTGAELGTIVAAERPGLPLVLITGYASALDEQKVKAMGFAAMLMKPVTMDLLDRTLREARNATIGPAR